MRVTVAAPVGELERPQYSKEPEEHKRAHPNLPTALHMGQ